MLSAANVQIPASGLPANWITVPGLNTFILSPRNYWGVVTYTVVLRNNSIGVTCNMIARLLVNGSPYQAQAIHDVPPGVSSITQTHIVGGNAGTATTLAVQVFNGDPSCTQMWIDSTTWGVNQGGGTYQSTLTAFTIDR